MVDWRNIPASTDPDLFEQSRRHHRIDPGIDTGIQFGARTFQTNNQHPGKVFSPSVAVLRNAFRYPGSLLMPARYDAGYANRSALPLGIQARQSGVQLKCTNLICPGLKCTAHLWIWRLGAALTSLRIPPGYTVHCHPPETVCAGVGGYPQLPPWPPFGTLPDSRFHPDRPHRSNGAGRERIPPGGLAVPISMPR